MAFNTWDTEALERFPDLLDRFEGVVSMYELWNELADVFKSAYQPPKNEDLIHRIYDFAHWCCDQPTGETASDDLGTCVTVCFLEEIPTTDAAIKDMPKWFSQADVLTMKPSFSSIVGEEGFLKILDAYQNISKST